MLMARLGLHLSVAIRPNRIIGAGDPDSYLCCLSPQLHPCFMGGSYNQPAWGKDWVNHTQAGWSCGCWQKWPAAALCLTTAPLGISLKDTVKGSPSNEPSWERLSYSFIRKKMTVGTEIHGLLTVADGLPGQGPRRVKLEVRGRWSWANSMRPVSYLKAHQRPCTTGKALNNTATGWPSSGCQADSSHQSGPCAKTHEQCQG